MNSIRQDVSHKIDFKDFDTLDESIDDDHADDDAFNLAVWADGIPFLPSRVVAYAGSPGAMVACPVCNLAGRRVGGWGEYTCENCGYSNLQDRPMPDALH